MFYAKYCDGKGPPVKENQAEVAGVNERGGGHSGGRAADRKSSCA